MWFVTKTHSLISVLIHCNPWTRSKSLIIRKTFLNIFYFIFLHTCVIQQIPPITCIRAWSWSFGKFMITLCVNTLSPKWVASSSLVVKVLQSVLTFPTRKFCIVPLFNPLPPILMLCVCIGWGEVMLNLLCYQHGWQQIPRLTMLHAELWQRINNVKICPHQLDILHDNHQSEAGPGPFIPRARASQFSAMKSSIN